MRQIVGLTFVALLALGASSCGPSESVIATGIASTNVVLAAQAQNQTATAVAAATATPTTTPTPVPPTHTPMPEWCYQSPDSYLRQVDQILDDREAAIVYWNNSARGDAQLLQTEIMIREVIERAEALVPPRDFQAMHEHLNNALQATLASLFGITDRADEHRVGSNLTMQEEFDLMDDEWERALAARDVACR